MGADPTQHQHQGQAAQGGQPPQTTPSLPRDNAYFVGKLRALALELRSAVAQGMRTDTIEELATATGDRGGDTIYHLDEHGEDALLAYCDRWGAEQPLLLIAEGLEDGGRIFPADADPRAATFTLIVDPIDGTRGLMYGKRSAWALFGVAPAPQPDWRPTLADIQVALQAELPTLRAALADVLWAARGEGAQAETHDLRTGAVTSFTPCPSRATTLAGGFASLVKFFPGAKTLTADLEERLFAEVVGTPPTESPLVFDDEYISSGGQLYELMVGHDRFIADLRPNLHAQAGATQLMCAHPYDLCTALIAQEAGVIVADPWGAPLAAPLDTHTGVAWVGYASAALHQSIAPVLQRLLREREGGAVPRT
ncbi:MAG TPA: inositol monophosphatase [Ktedonobacterales bacterium]|nr:inositol monophosphatase [Ktedonobacterales bacterium]